MCWSICAVLQHINERVVVVNVVVHDQDSYSSRCLGMDRLRQERTVAKVKPTNGLSKLQNGSQTLDSRTSSVPAAEHLEVNQHQQTNNNNNNNTLIYIAPACRMTSEALADSSSRATECLTEK